MATISGTITGANLVAANVNGLGARKAYLVTADFGAYTGASDTAALSAVGAAISSRVANGKTITLRGAIPVQAGGDTANQAVYFTGSAVQALTVSTDDLTGNLSNAAGTELTSSTACTGVGIIVIVDES